MSRYYFLVQFSMPELFALDSMDSLAPKWRPSQIQCGKVWGQATIMDRERRERREEKGEGEDEENYSFPLRTSLGAADSTGAAALSFFFDSFSFFGPASPDDFSALPLVERSRGIATKSMRFPSISALTC